MVAQERGAGGEQKLEINLVWPYRLHSLHFYYLHLGYKYMYIICLRAFIHVAGVRLNKAAAKRFVRGALWESSSEPSEQELNEGDSNDRKRKSNADVSAAPQAKRTHTG